MKIVYTKAAQVDLNNTLLFLLEQSPQGASQVLDRIEEQILPLSTQPEMGRPGRVAETRELIVSDTSFIIPYQVIGDELVILRVYHSSRKWPGTS